MRRMLGIWAIVAVALPGVAWADDPHDPAMRMRAARERDRAEIARLNRAQLAYVQRRDAGYAQGWAAWREARAAGGAVAGDSRAQDDYAEALARHARDMADWRQQVEACRAGDWRACE